MIGLRKISLLYRSEQFVRFLIVGGVALLLNWLSRFVFNWYLSFGWAITMAYLVGILAGFILNKMFVFPYSDRSLNFELSFFFFVNIMAFPFVWAIGYVLGEWIFVHWFPKQFALALGHGFAITSPVFVNFALHKFFTFRGALEPTKKGSEIA